MNVDMILCQFLCEYFWTRDILFFEERSWVAWVDGGGTVSSFNSSKSCCQTSWHTLMWLYMPFSKKEKSIILVIMLLVLIVVINL